MLDSLRQDLRYALRGIRRAPATFLLAAASLAVGIGVNATVLTWLDSLVLRPLPAVPDPARLVAFNWAPADGSKGGVPPFSYPALQAWRAGMQGFEAMAASSPLRLNLRVDGSDLGEPGWGELVTGNYFEVVRIGALLGRVLHPDEETSAAPVVVLSEAFWRRRFGSDSTVIGRHLFANGVDLTVVGVAAPGYAGTVAGLGFDLWMPLSLQPYVMSGGSALQDRSRRWLRGIARLRPGVTVAAADAELAALARRESGNQGESPLTSASVERLRDQQLGSLLFPLLSATLAVTGLVLLLACANVANLLLARGLARRRELAVRLAVGAGRGRLLRQLLAEHAVLAAAGCAGGILLALLLKESFGAFIPPVPEPVAYTLVLRPRVLALVLLATAATVPLFGLLPALRASRPGLLEELKAESSGGSGVGRERGRLRGVLLVAQLVICVVALGVAGLFTRSLARARDAELGIRDPEHVLLVATDLNLMRVSEREALALLDRLLERLRALPGVEAAAGATMVPLGFGGHAREATRVEGYLPSREEDMQIERVRVTGGYFATMGIPIVRGRGIGPEDRAGTMRVAVVNESFARRYWPGLDPLGRRIEQGSAWVTVVGVAKDGRYSGPGDPPYPLVYSPLAQAYRAAFTLHLRTTQRPLALMEALRREARAVHGELPLLDPRSLADHMQASTFVQRLGASMLAAMGAVALLLAAVGLSGVVALAVRLRARELAVRMALGETRAGAVRRVLQGAFGLVAVGLVLGLLAGIGVAQLFRSQLIGVPATDPVSFAAVAVLLGLTALLASWLPARRVSRIDPAATLRAE